MTLTACRDLSDAIENDRFEPYVVHSAEDFYGVIAKYQLLDEVPTVRAASGHEL